MLHLQPGDPLPHLPVEPAWTVQAHAGRFVALFAGGVSEVRAACAALAEAADPVTRNSLDLLALVGPELTTADLALPGIAALTDAHGHAAHRLGFAAQGSECAGVLGVLVDPAGRVACSVAARLGADVGRALAARLAPAPTPA